MIVLEGEKICMPEPCVLGIGKFECFHLGHKALVSEMMRLARGDRPAPKLPGIVNISRQSPNHDIASALGRRNPNHDIASALVMFEPHPYRVLSDPGYKPLFTGLERERLAEGLGVDFLLKFPFNRDFAAMPPEDFCRMIFEDLQARAVVVGMGYRFGYGRMGTVDTLRKAAGEYGAVVRDVALHGGLGHAVAAQEALGHATVPHESLAHTTAAQSELDAVHKTSTSTIRELLGDGMLAGAEKLLGYPFFAIGEIARGRQLGRTIGFPTINLYPPVDKFLPGDGVYVSRVCVDGGCYRGVTNIGVCPTVGGGNAARTIETYLLDFDGGELYGREAKVEFLRFVRPERKFESLEALKAQILLDCAVAGVRHSG